MLRRGRTSRKEKTAGMGDARLRGGVRVAAVARWRGIAVAREADLARTTRLLAKIDRAPTKADHLRFILAEIRRLLYSHPKIETRTVRVRLIDISSSTPTVELLSYVLTQDFNEFGAVRPAAFSSGAAFPITTGQTGIRQHEKASTPA